jgi:hypothetical protein
MKPNLAYGLNRSFEVTITVHEILRDTSNVSDFEPENNTQSRPVKVLIGQTTGGFVVGTIEMLQAMNDERKHHIDVQAHGDPTRVTPMLPADHFLKALVSERLKHSAAECILHVAHGLTRQVVRWFKANP